MAFREKLRIFGLFLLLATVCYANSLPNPFIQDDLLIVQNNEEIRRIAPLRFLSGPYSHDERFAGTYRPLTILSFSLDYSLWRGWAPGFRFTNLVLHAINGFLVFLLVRSILPSLAVAAAAGAVYLAHPVHTEAVVGIVGRGELLAATCFFSAWLLFRTGRTLPSAAAFLLGLLSKESVIMLPAIAALDLALLQGSPKKLLTDWRRFTVLAGVAVLYLGLRWWVLGSLVIPAAAQYRHGSLSTVERLMTTGRVYLEYFRLAVAPVNVIGVYEFDSIPVANTRDWVAWAGLVLVASTIALGIWLAKTRPVMGFAILFFFVALLPVSNWFIPIGAIMAERFLYTPAFAIAILAGGLWASISSSNLRRITGAGVLTIAVLLCIGHNYIWRDNLSFYGNMVRLFPQNMTGRLGYGLALVDRDRPAEAVQQFEAAVRIAPMSPTTLADIAGSIVQKDPGRCDQARPLLDAAFQAQENHWQSYWVLANCSYAKGRIEKAEEFYRLAAKYTPKPNGDLLYSLGAVLERTGKRAEAIDVYERAAAAKPDDIDIRRRLAALKQ
jgi:tetratricopeptide (TPR) repeat protein